MGNALRRGLLSLHTHPHTRLNKGTLSEGLLTSSRSSTNRKRSRSENH